MYGFKVVKAHDTCQWCKCGVELEKGDEVMFFNASLSPLQSDICPVCVADETDEPDEEHEVIKRWKDKWTPAYLSIKK